MSRYGIDMTNIEEQLKSAGVNISSVGNDFEEYRKNVSFDEKYNEKIANKGVKTYSIQNDKNNVNIVLEKENVILMSEKTIDLTDIELNEFLCSYKKLVDDKKLKINICENTKKYDY